ncbi:MAG: Maf family protein [Erysipelotrichaceae bacterium]|nr:Maf family protein [Erysipelotrichaceae bacterium]
MKIVLASKSPRRKELMKELSIPFVVDAVEIVEEVDSSLSFGQAIEQIALQKAMAMFPKYPKDLIIAADTLVCKGETYMGKPKDEQSAFAMLKELSGTTHQVITGVAMLKEDKKELFHVVSEVTFYDLEDEEIHAYLQTGEYKDKAGAYAIQGKGKLFVAKIEGDYYNIVGLPIAMVHRKLKPFL